MVKKYLSQSINLHNTVEMVIQEKSEKKFHLHFLNYKALEKQ